jgi:putative endonuclease
MKRKRIGQIGEDAAVVFFKKKGYQVIERNFSTRFGEIDLIVKKNCVLVFVEVKTRTGPDYGQPEWAISQKKIHQVQKMAEIYLVKEKPKYKNLRIDAFCVILDQQGFLQNTRHWQNLTLIL